ncbi:MAG: GTP-binding protein [Planctomycetes bacterium]|nr:GTP-binding protein [Planctomycetota bacterium]MCB9868222.1 GTP-binding protein [Planctomycetota bacterium]
MIRKKVVMLGSFSVGKTSLVRRFVSGIFSDRYLTTIGVRIDKKELVVDGNAVTLVLWDLHGDDDFQAVQPAQLRGSAGYFLVADGTRGATLDVARRLQDLAQRNIGSVPFTLLLNKVDLESQWEIDPRAIAELEAGGWPVQRTSAKTGDGVEQAFADLARRMTSGGNGS